MRVLNFLLLVLSVNAYCQDSLSLFRKRAEDNLQLVCNDYQLRTRVQIDKTGIIVYKTVELDTVLFSIQWKEIPKFIEIVENWDLKSMNEAFENKDKIP